MTASPTLPAALVLGLSPTGLLILRALGRRGIPVFGADDDPGALGRHSRFCKKSPELDQALQQPSDDALIQALERWAQPHVRPPVLFLTSDALIERLLPWAGRLGQSFALATPLIPATADMLDKRRFYALCEQLAEPHAKSVWSDAGRPKAEEIQSLAFPLIVKPAYSHRHALALRGRKVAQAHNPAELDTHLQELTAVDGALLVQEVIQGPDDAIAIAGAVVNAEGQLAALFVGRKLRQFRPRFGSASLAVSEWNSEVAERVQRFVEGSGIRGLVGLEFKRDSRDGTLKMIEVNARATLWMALAGAAGVDLPLVAWAAAAGEPIPPSRQRDGIRWAYLPRDTQSALQLIREGSLTPAQWQQSLRGLKVEAVLALDDPGPSIALPLYGLRRIAYWRRAHSG